MQWSLNPYGGCVHRCRFCFAVQYRVLAEQAEGVSRHTLGSARGQQCLGQTFGEIVDRYERVRYGSFAVAPEFLSELSDLVARLRSAALLGMRPERPAA